MSSIDKYCKIREISLISNTMQKKEEGVRAIEKIYLCYQVIEYSKS